MTLLAPICMKQPFLHHPMKKTMNSNAKFELDLMDFQGEALELHFEIPGKNAAWILESDGDDELPLRLEEDLPFRAQLRAQLIGTTVYLSGNFEGSFAYRCGRCLEWRRIDLDEEVEFVLMSRHSWEDAYHGKDEIVLEEGDLDISFYDDEIIDLRPLLREAVLLELPTFPICPEEASQACDAAYQKVVGEAALEENKSNSIDLRWAKLRDIKLRNDN